MATTAAVRRAPASRPPHRLAPLFAPRSIAVVGPADGPEAVGYRLVANLLDYGYGGTLHAVVPGQSDVLGLKAVPEVAALEGPIDLVLIAVPREEVLLPLGQAARVGAKVAVVLSAGWSETGGEGRKAEERLRAIAAREGIRLLGPNSMGIYNIHAKINGTGFWELPRAKGNVSVVSQSGALGGFFFAEARTRALGLAKFVSLGNQLDIDAAEVIDYLTDDPQTKVIALFLEDVKDGPALLAAAGRASRKKPVVALKGGRSATGQRAALAHTGAPAVNYPILAAAFRRAGILLVEESEAFVDLVVVLSQSRYLPRGPRVALLTTAGGASVLAGDACDAVGLDVPPLAEATRVELRHHLPEFAADANPIDLTLGLDPARFLPVADAVLGDPAVDGLVALNIGVDRGEFAGALTKASRRHRKPVAVFAAAAEHLEELLREGDLPCLPTPERTVRAYAGLVRYAEVRARREGGRPETAATRDAGGAALRLLGSNGGLLDDRAAKRLLRAYGIPICREQAVQNPDAAVAAAEALGYPVVVKAGDPAIAHKAERQGIFLGLADAAAVREAIRRLQDTFGPGSVALVQEMLTGGVELLLGGRRDRTFGPVVAFGMGGRLAEFVDDVALAPVPVDAAEAGRLVASVRGARLLEQGGRGVAPVHLTPIVELILAVSRLMAEHDEVVSLGINPLIVCHGKVAAVDVAVVTR